MEADAAEFLAGAGLAAYLQQLADLGYDSMEVLELMGEQHMREAGLKPGHALLLAQLLQDRRAPALKGSASKRRQSQAAVEEADAAAEKKRRKALRRDAAAESVAESEDASGKPAEEAGVYVVTFDNLPVNQEPSRSSEVVGMLAKGTLVKVVEVLAELDDGRSRGRIENPPGFISLTFCDFHYAEKKNQALRRDAAAESVAESEDASGKPAEEDRRRHLKPSKMLRKAQRADAAARVAAELGAPVELEEAKTAETEYKSKDARKVDETQEEEQSNFRVFVACLPWTISDETIRKDFEECGKILHIRQLTDKDTGKPRGVAFITYANECGVQAAIKYDGTEYGGRALKVQRAESRAESMKNRKPEQGKGSEGKGRGSQWGRMQGRWQIQR